MRYLFFEHNPRFSVSAQLAFLTQRAHEPQHHLILLGRKKDHENHCS